MGIFFFLKLSFGHKHTNARTSNKIRDRSSKYPLLLRAIQSGNHSLVVAALVVVVFPLFGSQLSITSLMTIIIIIRRPAPRVVEWVEEKEALFQITTQKVVKKKKKKKRTFMCLSFFISSVVMKNKAKLFFFLCLKKGTNVSHMREVADICSVTHWG